MVPQEAGAADGGEDEGQLHGMRAGRGDMHGQRAAQEGRLHAHGIALRQHCSKLWITPKLHSTSTVRSPYLNSVSELVVRIPPTSTGYSTDSRVWKMPDDEKKLAKGEWEEKIGHGGG